MKIALLKQDVYQDLYIGDKTFSPKELLFSSIMRVGPIGLFTLYDTDFYIIKEDLKSKECRIWEEILDIEPNLLRTIRNKPFNKSEFFKKFASFKQPGSNEPHSKYAIDYNEVNWEIYDIVISINICLPTKIVSRYTNTLWCYMIGEANKFTTEVSFGYDCCLNQENRGYVFSEKSIIDFPYTFIGPDCLEKIISNESPINNKQGIYLEINNTTERPFKIPDYLKQLKKTGHELVIHKQNIRENIFEIYRSKYFVKIAGRLVRGNGIYEAISCGTLVLCNPHLLIHTQILPKECWVITIDEVVETIKSLEQNPIEYKRLIALQRNLLKHFVIDCPMESLQNELIRKKNRKKLQKSGIKHKIKFLIKNFLKKILR